MAGDGALKNTEANVQNPEAGLTQEQISHKRVRGAVDLVQKSTEEIKLFLAQSLDSAAQAAKQRLGADSGREMDNVLYEAHLRIEATGYQMWDQLTDDAMVAQYNYRLVQQTLAPEIWSLVQQQKIPVDVAQYYLNTVYHRLVTERASGSTRISWGDDTDNWLDQARSQYSGIKDVESDLSIDTSRFSSQPFEKYREIISVFTNYDLLTAIDPQIDELRAQNPNLPKHGAIVLLSGDRVLEKINEFAMDKAYSERVKSLLQTPGMENVFSKQAIEAFYQAVALRREVEPLGDLAVEILKKYASWQPIENLTRIKDELLKYKEDKQMQEKFAFLKRQMSVDSLDAFLLWL